MRMSEKCPNKNNPINNKSGNHLTPRLTDGGKKEIVKRGENLKISSNP